MISCEKYDKNIKSYENSESFIKEFFIFSFFSVEFETFKMTKILSFSDFNSFIRFEIAELFMKKSLQAITNINYKKKSEFNKRLHVKNSMIV